MAAYTGKWRGAALPSRLWFIALGWFAFSLWAVLWIWGLDPLVFPTPDESVVRYAAQLIGDHRPPFLSLPFPDPEDLFHPRGWITIGDRAWPSYAPVGFYAYGYLLRLGKAGLVLIAALPASAIAAFSAGVGNLLPRPRQWLAALAPLLAFPAVYWLLRPWANVSPLLIGCAWCVFCWSRWRTTERARWLAAAAVALTFATGVRPDCAAFAYLAFVPLCLAASPTRWRLIIALVVASGLFAVGLNLALNKLITGNPLRAAYQVAVERMWGPNLEPQLPGLAMLRSVLLPMGIPEWSVFANCFEKYWLRMGPMGLILLGQLSLVPLLRAETRQARLLTAAAVLALMMFAGSRMHDDLFGAKIKIGEYHHSVPRYLTPVYLLAAVPPLLFVGRARRRWLVIVGSVLLVGVAASAGYELAIRESASLSYVKGYVSDKEWTLAQAQRRIPPDATVYTLAEDKWLWSAFRVTTISRVDISVPSIERAVNAGLKVYLVQPHPSPIFRRLAAALRGRPVRLARVDRRRGIYRVDPIAPSGPLEPTEPSAPPAEVPEPAEPARVSPSEPEE